MLDLLERIREVLIGDTVAVDPVDSLEALMGANRQIGVNIRKSPQLLGIEFGIESGTNAVQDKSTSFVRVTVYGTTDVTSTLKIADRVAVLMTPRALTDETRNLKVGRSKKTRYAVLPENDFGHQAEMVFEMKLYNPTP